MANVPVGATISLQYEIITAEYHALRITNQDWSSDIVPQIDGFENQPNPYEFTYTADHKAIADAKGMLIMQTRMNDGTVKTSKVFRK